MRGIVHPPVHSFLGVVVGARTGVNDLSAPPAGITSRNLALPVGGTIRTGVRHEIIFRLVIAVDAGRVLERIGIRQCPQACRGALGVDQAEQLVLEGAIMDQTASGASGGARRCGGRGTRTRWRGGC